MVFTLHRYIFREIFKVFILSAVALTLILSLGSILRPVAEYGAGPRQVVHLMGYFLPITLTFVLPMAALFATALVYGRFASDNELDACRASGISLLTLVYPGLALAIMVATANLILSFHVMPAFVKRAEKSLKADAKQILFRNVQRNGYYKLPPDGRYLIYADRAEPQNDMLWGVVVTEVKGCGIKRIITAERASVHFNPHEKFNEVQITAYNTHQMGTADAGSFYAEQLPVSTEFGSLLSDDIKFKKIDEIKRIRADLMRFYPIAKLAHQTYAQFITELLAEFISAQTAVAPRTGTAGLGTTNPARGFCRLHSGQKLVEFTAESCCLVDEQKIELSGDVMVIESDVDSGQPLLTLRSAKAWLHIEAEESSPMLTMYVDNPTWQQWDGLQGLAQRHIIRGLVLPAEVTDRFASEDVLRNISPASITSALQKEPGPVLKDLQSKLHRKIRKSLAEIKAEIHSRLVFGIGCVTLIMIGIGLGFVFKGGHLLSAFGASSVPAAVLIVCIMMGKNITKNLGAQAGSGVAMMWVGLAFLSLLAGLLYHRLLKN